MRLAFDKLGGFAKKAENTSFLAGPELIGTGPVYSG